MANSFPCLDVLMCQFDSLSCKSGIFKKCEPRSIFNAIVCGHLMGNVLRFCICFKQLAFHAQCVSWGCVGGHVVTWFACLCEHPVCNLGECMLACWIKLPKTAWEAYPKVCWWRGVLAINVRWVGWYAHFGPVLGVPRCILFFPRRGQDQVGELLVHVELGH